MDSATEPVLREVAVLRSAQNDGEVTFQWFRTLPPPLKQAAPRMS
jgi:hypothetical protein